MIEVQLCFHYKKFCIPNILSQKKMKRQNPKAKTYQDQRPIKGSSSGKYNLNFIDPMNDLASYYNGQLPQLEDLINEYFETVTFSEFQNQKNHFIPAINMCESQLFEISNKKQKITANDHCSVCTENFKQNEQVKVLPCKHCFHKNCIKPWFEVNSKCPNCRFDLYEGKCVND